MTTTREEAVELGRQCAAQRGKIQSLARAGRHPEAGALAVECVPLVGRLRAEAGNAMALQQAEQLFRLVASLTRVEAVSYLPALSRTLAEFSRCCQQAGQHARAAGMFGSAVEAQKILLASKQASEGEDDLAVAIELIDLMSNHALALAKSEQLTEAYEVAREFVELGRGRLPRALPLLTGGLAFMADLASDLGRPRDGIEHLVDGLRLLGAATVEGLPGARDAGVRMAGRLRTAAAATQFELPDDVASLLTTLAPA
jgi:tetratricopeptide (TPR) repeat protein